jgi:amino acid transporter
MSQESQSHVNALKKSLGLSDMVLLNISCIVSFTSIAQVAQFGYGSIFLYLLAIVAYLIPSGIVVAELNARMPEEGGFYVWVREAFGDFHGYMAAWSYWLCNVVWLPTTLILISMAGLYMIEGDFSAANENTAYNGVIFLVILWVITSLNIIGLERAKWIQNVGAMASWGVIAFLLITGIYYTVTYGSAHPFQPYRLIPDLSDFSILPFFAIVAFCFGGLELGPVMAGEVQNPTKNIPRAIFLSAVAVGVIYIAGTSMLIVTIPEGEIREIDGAVQAFHRVGEATGWPILGFFGAVVVILSTLGLFGAWLVGNARMPFVVGIDHYLPEAFGRLHPKYGSPYVALLVQAAVLSVLSLSFIVGSSMFEGFMILLDMSIILYFLPILYIFASFLKLIIYKRNEEESMFLSLKTNKSLVWIIGGMGFLITFISMVMSAIPTGEIENKWAFPLKVVGGAIFLLSCGLFMYLRRRNEIRKAA